MPALADSPWAACLIDAAAKGFALLAVAAAVNLLALRRRSAALRHMVWCLAAGGLLCLPILTAALPALHVRILPAPPSPSPALAAAPESRVPVLPVVVTPPALRPTAAGESTPVVAAGEPRRVEVLSSSAVAPPSVPSVPTLPSSPSQPRVADPERSRGAVSQSPVSPPPVPSRVPWTAWVLPVWSAGAAACLLPLLVGSAALARRLRRARPVDDPDWLDLLESLCRRLDVTARVRLLVSPDATIPSACGLLRPTILLPAEAAGWPAARRRVVLLHELAHVKRRDPLAQMLSRVAWSLHWFNPLAPVAARGVRTERERACDDLVLAAGLKASDYAAHLLDVATTLRMSPLASLTSVAMAHPGQFEGRLLAIMDARRNRQALTGRGALAAAILVAAVTVPLSFLRATAAAPELGDAAPPPAPAKPIDRLMGAVEPVELAGLWGLPGGPDFAAQEMFWRGQFAAMAAHYAARNDLVSFYWAGQGYQLAGQWRPAAASFHKALDGLSRQIEQADEKAAQDPQAARLHRQSRRALRGIHAGLALLTGKIERHQLQDLPAAAATLAEGIRYWPEVNGSIGELAKLALPVLAASKSQYDRPNREHAGDLLIPLCTQRDLAEVCEQTGQSARALECRTRIRLCDSLYVLGTAHLRTDPVQVADLWRRLPEGRPELVPVLGALTEADPQAVIDPAAGDWRLRAWFDNSWNQFSLVAPPGRAFDKLEIRCEFTVAREGGLSGPLSCWGGTEGQNALGSLRLLDTRLEAGLPVGQHERTFQVQVPRDVGIVFLWLPEGRVKATRATVKAAFRAWDPARAVAPAAVIGVDGSLRHVMAQLDGQAIDAASRAIAPGPHTLSVREPIESRWLHVPFDAQAGQTYLLHQTAASPLKPVSPSLPASNAVGPAGGSVVRLRDGRYLMATGLARNTTTQVWLTESKDGRQWGPAWPYEHNAVFATSRPNLIVDDAGTIWMVYFAKRLACDFSSAGGILWVTQSPDGRAWAAPRPIRVYGLGTEGTQYHNLAHLTRGPGGRYWLFYGRFAGSGDTPGQIGQLQPLPPEVPDSGRVQNPYAVFDAGGVCHLVYDDFADAIRYTRSADMHTWSAPVDLVKNDSHNCQRPQLVLKGSRVALIYESNEGHLRTGTLTKEGIRLDEPSRRPAGLGPLNGGRLAELSGRVFLPAAGADYAPWLLTGSVEDLLAPGAGGPPATQPVEAAAAAAQETVEAKEARLRKVFEGRDVARLVPRTSKFEAPALPEGSPFSDDAAVRTRWVEAMGEIGDQRTAEFVVEALEDPDAGVRQAAGKALRKMTGEMMGDDAARWRAWWQKVRRPAEKPEALVAMLDDPRPEARRRAIWKLGWLADPATVEPLLERFVGRKGGAVRGAAVYKDEKQQYQDAPHLQVALTLIGEPAAKRLIPVAGYGWRIKEQALEALVQIRPPAAMLVQALSGPDRYTREGATSVLAVLKPLEAVAPLVRAAQDLRGGSGDPFGALAAYDKSALPALKQAFGEAGLGRLGRGSAAIVMMHLGDNSAEPLLSDLVRNGTTAEMNELVSRMGTTKDKAFLPLASAALDRKDAWQQVAYAVAFCGGADAIPALRKALNHPNAGVQYGAKVWLRKLGAPDAPPE